MNKRVNVILLISVLLISIFVAGIVQGYTTGDKITDKDGTKWTRQLNGLWTNEINPEWTISDDVIKDLTPDTTKQILDKIAEKDPTGCGWLLPKSSPVMPAVGEYFFYDRCVLWIGGAKINELDARQAGVIGNFVKWFVLLLVIILIYTALAEVEFPSSSILRIIIAILVGFLSTFFITTKELITALTGYSALGITLIVFFPIAILAFFTVVIARKAKAFGLYAQKIMWTIYSVFLLLKTGILFVIMQGWTNTNATGIETFWGIPLGVAKSAVSNYDTTILVTLFIVAIAVFVIMVPGNKIIREWLAGEAAESGIEAQKEVLKKSQGLRKAEADVVDNT